jgi:hypothetical protein
MSDFNQRDWLRLKEKHTGLAHLASTLRDERARADEAKATLESANSNIEYTLELYLRSLDELSMLEYNAADKQL